MSEPAVIQQAYRFALAPTYAQAEFLEACAGASRFWFNQGLALVKQRLNERAAGADVDVPWSYKALCVAFRGDAIKDQLAPWRAEVVTGSYQAGLEALGKALQNYSAGRKAGRRVGFPRFRANGRCHEAVIFQLLATDPNARVMRSTVQRSGGGWVISFTVQRSPKKRRARRPNAVVGVDVGLARLATVSTGECFENSRPLQAELKNLRRLQRRLDRQRRHNNPDSYLPDGRVKPGPRTWVKSARMVQTERRIAKLHERVANLRRHQAHLLTARLVREFGVIGVEMLQITSLMANRRLARHISDVGWGMVLDQLRYKSSWSDGSALVAADRSYPSSKTCSACGAVKAKLRLADRVFTCDASTCGHVQDRDLNAALNLARMAHRHAQAEGIPSYVARIGRFTPTARGGQVSLVASDQHSPVKCEASSDASQRREALAAA